MNRQNTSRKMFGLIMLTVALLLVACGSGDGDATPTPTSEANAAVPTLPVNESTAQTEVISQEDLTVVTPALPATASATESVATAAVVTPPATVAAASTPVVAGTTPTEAASAVVTSTVASTPTVRAEAVASPPAAIAAPTQVGTPTAAVEGTTVAVPTLADATPAATEGGSFESPGDGTGGSGQPGERSSNVPGEATASASPVSLVTVEGCEVAEVPAFTGASTAYVTNAEVNFRSGPGIDCNPILEEPLAEGVAVVVLGGPVTQGADNSNWLQVEVDGVPGWVSLEFVEPAE